MAETTTFSRLAKISPQSETHWRAIAASVHRKRGFPGDEAAARTHELVIYEIRSCLAGGTSRSLRLCPRCLERHVRIALIEMGGQDRCGTCLWPGVREDVRIPGL